MSQIPLRPATPAPKRKQNPPHLLLWDFKYFSFSDDDCTNSLIKMDHHSTFGLFSSVGSTLIPLCFFLCVSLLFAAPKGGPHKNHHQHQPRERKKIHLPTFPLFLLFGSVIFHSCWNRSENIRTLVHRICKSGVDFLLLYVATVELDSFPSPAEKRCGKKTKTTTNRQTINRGTTRRELWLFHFCG